MEHLVRHLLALSIGANVKWGNLVLILNEVGPILGRLAVLIDYARG